MHSTRTAHYANKSYEDFRGAVDMRVDTALRSAIVSKAWAERPSAVKSEMIDSTKFNKQREEFNKERSKAEADFGIKVRDTEPFPLEIDVRSSNVTVTLEDADAYDEPPSSEWTPAGLRKAAQDADALPLAQEQNAADSGGAGPSLELKENNESEEPTDEMAKEVLDKIDPAGKLCSSRRL